jgi:hypothetical protein
VRSVPAITFTVTVAAVVSIAAEPLITLATASLTRLKPVMAVALFRLEGY